MPTPDSDTSNYELSLTSSDIYLVAEQDVLLQADAERLVRWSFEQRFNQSGLAEPKAIFYLLVKRGTYIEPGMKIGYVTDYFGKVSFEAHAPAASIILYVCAVPSMTKGATIASIGVVARQHRELSNSALRS